MDRALQIVNGMNNLSGMIVGYGFVALIILAVFLMIRAAYHQEPPAPLFLKIALYFFFFGALLSLPEFIGKAGETTGRAAGSLIQDVAENVEKSTK